MEASTYRFYLEPYCLIFREDQELLIYNTLNGAYVRHAETPILAKVIEELQDPAKGYVTEIEEKALEDESFRQFTEELRETFSGDLITLKEAPHKPFLFPPILFVREKMAHFDRAFSFVGREILRNINEAFIYLDAPCDRGCPDCKKYNRQFPHCSLFLDEKALSLSEYKTLFAELEAAGVGKVNFLGGNLTRYESREDLLSMLTNYDFKKEFYFDLRQLSSSVRSFLKEDLSGITVWVHPPYDYQAFSQARTQFKEERIEWRLLVETEKNLDEVAVFLPEDETNVNVVPFYNNSNYSFFEKYVFYNLEDILANPIDKKTIFRRQVLNENYFGKIYLSPGGNVYTNLNLASVGNIREHTLTEMVFKEMETPYAWMKIRGEGACKNCVNKYLCPSPSDYEVALGKENLCRIKR